MSSLLTDLTKQLAGAIAEYQLSTILNKVLTNFQNDKPDGPALRERPGSEIIHLTLRTDGERDDVEGSSPCFACVRALRPSSVPSRLLSHCACRLEATEPLCQRDLACMRVASFMCVCVYGERELSAKQLMNRCQKRLINK